MIGMKYFSQPLNNDNYLIHTLEDDLQVVKLSSTKKILLKRSNNCIYFDKFSCYLSKTTPIRIFITSKYIIFFIGLRLILSFDHDGQMIYNSYFESDIWIVDCLIDKLMITEGGWELKIYNLDGKPLVNSPILKRVNIFEDIFLTPTNNLLVMINSDQFKIVDSSGKDKIIINSTKSFRFINVFELGIIIHFTDSVMILDWNYQPIFKFNHLEGVIKYIELGCNGYSYFLINDLISRDIEKLSLEVNNLPEIIIKAFIIEEFRN